MKQSLNTDTLAYQIGMRPALQHRDMSGAYLPDVVYALGQFEKSSNAYSVLGEVNSGEHEAPCGHPERDAILFYMLNHAMSLIRKRVHVYEPLGVYLPLVETYHAELAVRASRMFYYLLLICTRESRHDKSDKSGSKYGALKAKYPKEIIDFHASIHGQSSLGAAAKLQASPPLVKLGPYVEFLSDVFYQGSYNGGFGGKAWGKVADLLRDFVLGKVTAEMMLDTSFTLCHNNGPIFNKGMLYDSYTNEIYKILDVQRSGQIPQYVNGNNHHPLVTKLWKACEAILGAEFTGYVDWFLVEELGAVKTYPQEKQQQINKHGYPSKFKAKKEAEQAKAELIAKQKLEDLKSKIEIVPGQFITKVKVTR